MMDENNVKMTEIETGGGTRTESNSEDDEEIDLRELGYMLWKHIVQIVMCLVAGAVLAFCYTTFLVTKQYTATASMYVIGNQNSVIDMSALQIGSQVTADYQELITSEGLLNGVIDDLKLDMNYNTLVSKISLTNPSGTRVLKISVTDSDPQMAADIANAVAKQAKAKLPEYTKGTAPEIYNEAAVPSKPSSPSVKKNTMLGGIGLAAIYIAYLCIVFFMNDTFVTADDIYRSFGVQPIAVVPKFGKKKKRKNSSQKKGRKK